LQAFRSLLSTLLSEGSLWIFCSGSHSSSISNAPRVCRHVVASSPKSKAPSCEQQVGQALFRHDGCSPTCASNVGRGVAVVIRLNFRVENWYPRPRGRSASSAKVSPGLYEPRPSTRDFKLASVCCNFLLNTSIFHS